ncbi:MAG: DUF2277 domain-containing protein [Deltaproteobacteria bacterium]|nr:MAG: DUF2277 domain-containing protein [Deltaproteobacteria bacterium]
MCRNIKLLYNLSPRSTDEEIRASALQYVRKVSGMTRPSAANEPAIERAVEEITAITQRLLREDLVTRAEPKDREALAEAARERGRKREERMRYKILGELED